MPRDPSVKKVLVIGSGPIVIGQAAEFDYAGTQACRSLREEGISVVLVNSNPATIMTDLETADRVYIEPLTTEFLDRILAAEKPDSILPTLGGQTGLNLAAQLATEGILDKHGVRLLGTSLDAIHTAEDRELFRDAMRAINEPTPESWVVGSVEELRNVSELAPYPCIVRPAYTLGGTGGGIAYSPEELMEIGSTGLHMSMSSQILVERSLLGWKELEYEVMRDGADNAITICNMENLDPMGVHTGDSIVVAPSQTLSDVEYQLLRSSALRIIRSLKIEGGCNVQFAVSPHAFDYYVIEVNPRVSRSSALASKATGYPIARVSAKIAIGLRLDEIANAVTQKTKAFFEPALDYCVVKIPRWPFDKFTSGDRKLGTQMKATGEVMAIDRTFEGALMKALRSLEIGKIGLHHPKFVAMADDDLAVAAKTATDDRLWALIESLRRGVSPADLSKSTSIDIWFLEKISGLILGDAGLEVGHLGASKIFKMVDTCAGEFEAVTPYYYSTAGEKPDRSPPRDGSAVLVLGSGPIRIGQGVEFDYCSVHAVMTLREMGRRAIMVNSNPETVSTDFDISDALYFDPITLEDVLNICDHEKPEGVIVQFGGQTAVNLAKPLTDAGIKILGTPAAVMDATEDRDQFERLLSKLGLPKPAGQGVMSREAALKVAREIGYPVLVRPSFVLGGKAMRVAYNDSDINAVWAEAEAASEDAPVLVDKFLPGREAEVDVVCDGERTILSGIMEHIEAAGIHSGDSMAAYPPITLSPDIIKQIEESARRIALELGVVGMLNIQFLIADGLAYVLEVNPRASRTVPFISKVTGVPFIKLATQAMLGQPLPPQPAFPPDVYAVKAPVFSFQKLTKVEPMLGPEMKSTGEVMGIDDDYPSALLKAIIGAGLSPRKTGMALITVADGDKQRAADVARRFIARGYAVGATPGTCDALVAAGVEGKRVEKIGMGSPNILDHVRRGEVAVLINTASRDRKAEEEAQLIRRASVESGVPCITSMDTAEALVQALETEREHVSCRALDDYVRV